MPRKRKATTGDAAAKKKQKMVATSDSPLQKENPEEDSSSSSVAPSTPANQGTSSTTPPWSNGKSGYLFSAEKVAEHVNNFVPCNNDIDDEHKEADYEIIHADWFKYPNLSSLLETFNEKQKALTKAKTATYVDGSKGEAPVMPAELQNVDAMTLVTNPELFAKLKEYQKEMTKYEKKEPQKASDLKKAAVDKATTERDKAAKKYKKWKNIIQDINPMCPSYSDSRKKWVGGVEVTSRKGVPGVWATNFTKFKAKMLDNTRKYNDTVNRFADENHKYYIPRAHLILSKESIVAIKSSDLYEIYSMVGDDVKAKIDKFDILSMVEGKQLKRDFSQALNEETKQFPVATKEVKEDKKLVTKPVVNTGIAQVKVTAETEFKNPFFEQDDWLSNKIASYNATFHKKATVSSSPQSPGLLAL